jgi:hypothetical protein
MLGAISQAAELAEARGAGMGTSPDREAMTPAEFRAAIAKVGLSQAAAGVWFGRSCRTGQRWASGEYEVPDYVARFLRFMVRCCLEPTDMP